MDSVSNWGINPAVKSELWGNSSTALGSGSSSSSSTGSFAQNSDRASSSLGNPSSAWNSTGAKLSQIASSSSNMWPSSEVSSKQDVGKWGVGLSGGNGGGGGGGGAGGGQSGQNDTESSWRSSASNSWTSNEKNDISGWGSPHRSPVPNAGTESWGSKTMQAEDRLAGWAADSRSNNGYLQPDARQASGSWSDAAGERSKQSQWGTAGSSGPSSASGAWSRGTPIMQPSQSVPTLGNQQPQQGAPGSWAQAVTNKSGQGAAGCGASGGGGAPASGVPDDSKASNQHRSQEELIAEAINSHDGWGKTAIRQDTAWVIEDAVVEQRKAPAATEATSEETAAQLARQVMTGTAIWESSKAAAASRAAEKSSEDRGAWSGTPVEKTAVFAANPANGPNPALAVGGNQASSAFRPPLEKPPGNSWPPGPPEKPSASWGASSTSSEGSWEGVKKDDDRMWELDSNKGSKTETGVWDRPLRPSSSSGSWTGDEVENVGWGDDKAGHPPEVDDGTSVWGDPSSQNRPQNWKHGNKQGSAGSSQFLSQRSRPDERGDGFFGMPPPAGIGIKQSGFGDQIENAVGPWNPSVPPPKPDGGWGDGHWPNVSGQRPPKSSSLGGAWDINDWMSGSRRNDFAMSGVGGPKGLTPQRSVVLQQLLNMGFRKEDAQNALISNNMNLDSAISELLATHLRDPEVADLHRGRGLLRPNDELTSDASSLDANSILFGMPSLGQLNNNPFSLGGVGGGANPQQALANSMRPVGPASLQPFGSSLGSQQSTMPDFSSLLQRTNQVMNNSVFSQSQQQQQHQQQQQQQQQQLMQQLVQSIHSAVQLGLLPKHLVKPHMLTNNNFIVNVQRLLQLHEMHQKLNEQCQLVQRQQGPVLSNAVQHHLLELIRTNNGLQQQIDQVKVQIMQMAAMPAAAASGGISAMPPVDQLLKGLQIKDDGTPSSRLMSQWKLDNDAEAKSVQHSGGGGGLDMPIAEPAWLPMSSSASSWSGASPAAAEDAAAISAGSTASTLAGDAKVPSSAGATQTSTLSSTTAALENAVSSGASVPASALDIEEFVPGKPWQGPSTKNVEDDPYITPGSVTRNSISTINDIQVMSILGRNNIGNSVGTDSRVASALAKAGSSQSLQSPATALSNTWLSEPPPSLSVDPWSRNAALPPPGLNIPNKPQWHYNRSVSWTPGDRTEYASMMNNWPGAPSNWLMIRNLTPQVENGTLQALCLQHGPVLKFFANVIRGGAIVGFGKVEDAAKAQRSLHSCKLGNTQLIVDFITESDVAQLLDPNGRGAAPPPPQPSAFARPPMPSLAGAYSGLHPGQLNRSDMVAAAAGQWGSATGGMGLGANSWNAIGAGSSWPLGLEDHGAAYLPGDLLGGQ